MLSPTTPPPRRHSPTAATADIAPQDDFKSSSKAEHAATTGAAAANAHAVLHKVWRDGQTAGDTDPTSANTVQQPLSPELAPTSSAGPLSLSPQPSPPPSLRRIYLTRAGAQTGGNSSRSRLDGSWTTLDRHSPRSTSLSSSRTSSSSRSPCTSSGRYRGTSSRSSEWAKTDWLPDGTVHEEKLPSPLDDYSLSQADTRKRPQSRSTRRVWRKGRRRTSKHASTFPPCESPVVRWESSIPSPLSSARSTGFLRFSSFRLVSFALSVVLLNLRITANSSRRS